MTPGGFTGLVLACCFNSFQLTRQNSTEGEPLASHTPSFHEQPNTTEARVAWEREAPHPAFDYNAPPAPPHSFVCVCVCVTMSASGSNIEEGKNTNACSPTVLCLNRDPIHPHCVTTGKLPCLSESVSLSGSYPCGVV